MSDLERVRAYKRGNPPSLPDNGKFVAEELKRLEQSFVTLTDAFRRLETRIVALEP